MMFIKTWIKRLYNNYLRQILEKGANNTQNGFLALDWSIVWLVQIASLVPISLFMVCSYCALR